MEHPLRYNPPGEKAGAVFAVDVTMDSTYVVTANADGSLLSNSQHFQFPCSAASL